MGLDTEREDSKVVLESLALITTHSGDIHSEGQSGTAKGRVEVGPSLQGKM